eukprot:TRINITY_DN1005_c0_g1_i4.p1 TRINITY_DN1005_c0_g1~~TRINITY_DN1005_c0_g1_i4.p1  ORF type:complete len:606 (+),score=144.58 TRINITY_DN1005_c0_g1_i4:83-1819(+)
MSDDSYGYQVGEGDVVLNMQKPDPTGDNALIDRVVSKAQQRRLRLLFDICDRDKDEHLSREEVDIIFEKLRRATPNAEILSYFNDHAFDERGLVSFQRFLLMFAWARERVRQSDVKVEGKLESLGAYMLKYFAKNQSANRLRKEIGRLQGDMNKLDNPTTTPGSPSSPPPPAPTTLQQTTAVHIPSSSHPHMLPDHASRISMMSLQDEVEIAKARWLFVLLSGVAGVFYALFTAVIDYRLQVILNYDGAVFQPVADWGNVMIYWFGLVGCLIFFSILEIICLFAWGLQASASVSYILGVEAWLVGYVPGSEHTITAMVRAAFDIPNPSSIYMGIKPTRYSSKLRVFLKALLWKAKISITTFVLRQIFFNVAARNTLPFLAIPVCAVWNMLIAWKVIHDVVSICLGNIFMPQLVEKFILPANPQPETINTIYHVAGTSIVLEGEVHPNLEALLKSMVRLAGPIPEGGVLDDKDALKLKLHALHDREEKLFLLQIFAVILATNSNVSYKSMMYLRDLAWYLDLNPDFGGVDRLHGDFHSARSIFLRHITILFRYTNEGTTKRWLVQLKMIWRTVMYNIVF